MRSDLVPSSQRSTGLVDVLDRVLDKGLVVAGDVKISLAEVELLTIRIRLIICSLDKAEQVGLDWWRHDTHLSPGRRQLDHENASLREQVRLLQEQVAALTANAKMSERPKPARPKARARRAGEPDHGR
jgi:hypothetical protein